MRRFSASVLILASAFILTSALAGSGAAYARPDGRVVVDDERVAAILSQTANAGVISEAAVRAFGPLLYEDNSLTPSESDLIVELLDNRYGTVGITAPDGSQFLVPQLTPAAHAFLSLSDPPDLNLMWMSGPVGMKQLIDVTLLNPHVRAQVQQYIAEQLYGGWAVAEVSGSLRAIRATLSAAISQWRLSDPETERRGRRFLYNAMLAIERVSNGELPDDLYAGLVP